MYFKMGGLIMNIVEKPGAYKVGGTLNGMELNCSRPLDNGNVSAREVSFSIGSSAIQPPLGQNQISHVSIPEDTNASRLYRNYNHHYKLRQFDSKLCRAYVNPRYRSPDGDKYRGIGNVMASVFWGIGVATSGFTFGTSLLVFGGIAMGIKGIFNVVAASADKEHKNEYHDMKYPTSQGYSKSDGGISISYNFFKGALKGLVAPLILLHQLKNLYDTRSLTNMLSKDD
jgi:hypothetical protein